LTRPNPIIVGLVTLTALVIGLEVRVLLKSRRHAHPAASDDTPPTELPLPASATAAPVVVDQVPERPPTPPPSPPPVTAAPSPPIAQTKRPLFVAPEPERVIRDADEQAFEMMRLPEATRAAIRKINEEHARTERALRDGLPPPPEGLPTRRAALDQLLGVEAGHQFDAAERVATKRLRSQYRSQSLHGVPPGSVDAR
jgi:hypothetical protein